MKHSYFNRLFIGTGIVVYLLTVLACSSAADLTNLFATETPTPTNTFTPSPTSTSTPSPTATPTKTPSPTPQPSGVTTEELSDGSTVFIDHDNRYQLALPKGWFVIPLSSEDLTDILQSMSEENPELKDIAEAFTQLDPDVIRVTAVNENPKYMDDGYATNLSITAIEDKLMSGMPMDFVTGAIEESLEQQGAVLLSDHNSVTTNTQGIELGSFDFLKTTPSANGGSLQVHSRLVVFQVDDKLIMIQLATPEQFGEELAPVIDQITDSIEIL